MKKTLFNCDQVFEVLTRGPFPTGEEDDEAVERHLRACHECRQLAEALRPAVALLHESIATDEATALPEYQGALPWKRPERRRLSMARLATAQEAGADAEKAGRTNLSPSAVDLALRSAPAVRAMRVLAASLLVFALGALLFAIAWAPNRELAVQSRGLFTAQTGENDQNGVPTAGGLVTLASLKLPQACLPDSHRPLTAEDAAEISHSLESGALAKLRCCTECHHAGASQPSTSRLIAVAEQNCRACHRS